MVLKHKSGSVLWTLEQNINTKKLLIEAADKDIKNATQRRADALEELAEIEKAYTILLTYLT